MKKPQKEKSIGFIMPGIILSMAISFLFFLYAPLELYFTNKNEFWFDFYKMIPILLVAFLTVAVFGSLVFYLLKLISERLYQMGLSVCFIAYIASYIQGNFLVKNLPTLDGSEIDWSLYTAERIKSIVVWVVVIIAILVLVKIVHKKAVYSVVKVVPACMSLMLLVTLVSVCIGNDGLERKKEMQITDRNLYEMSDDKNFIIFLLDATDSRDVTELMKNHPEYVKIFEDFTYYPNMLGAYPFTMLSIPYIFSGEWFENEQSFEEYNVNVYKSANFFDLLEDKSYHMGMYESELMAKDDSVYRFDNVLSRTGKISSWWEFLKAEIKLIGVKYAPFDLKRFCIVDTSYFYALQEAPENDDLYTSINTDFYRSLQNADVLHTDERCFKFIHVEGAHTPFRYNENVEVVENATYENNLEACMTITRTYLEKLKNDNVYDNSVIIIMADHGYCQENNLARQCPIFFAKGINERHGMEVSNAPVSFEDLQQAFTRLLEGRSSTEIFDAQEGEQRKRRYLFYVYLEEDHIEEYFQTGDAWDLTTLLPSGKIYIQKNTK